ncbi:unnamed protein product [Clonostachys byssicola]|uniref:MYND-type domain-containing protein n=1 Tax=Clonostachys byssicola TaxID=160290 RepID=A0A9N9Y1W5_9HYPO|nr:unnamed protein product [Clonostachys byssicola]
MATGSSIPSPEARFAWLHQNSLRLYPIHRPSPTITSINGPSSLPYDTMPYHGKCAGCGKHGRKLACSSCRVTGVGHLRVYYCSSECQKADWLSHREVCRSRQQVARAVSILIGLWAALQTSTYAERCDFSHEDNGLIAAEHWKNDQDRRCYTGASFFRRFPDDVIPKNMSARAEKAVLFDKNTDEVTSIGMPWVRRFLQPFCTKIEEIEINIKNPALMIGSLKFARHNVLRVTTKTGEVLAIDISSARYVFRRYRIDTILLECAIGNAAKSAAVADQLLLFAPGNPDAFLYKTRERLVNHEAEGMDRSMASIPGGISPLMSSPQRQFKDFQHQIIRNAKRFLDDSLAQLHRTGVGRMYFVDLNGTKDLLTAITPGTKYAELFKNVWFTEAEVAAFKDDQSLKKMWMCRMSRLHDSDKEHEWMGGILISDCLK